MPIEGRVVASEQSIEETDELGEPLSPVGRTDLPWLNQSGVRTLAAGTKPKGDTPVRDVVESHQFSSERNGVSKIGGGHESSQANPLAHDCCGGQCRHRTEPG
jgi:hypothetical protein